MTYDNVSENPKYYKQTDEGGEGFEANPGADPGASNAFKRAVEAVDNLPETPSLMELEAIASLFGRANFSKAVIGNLWLKLESKSLAAGVNKTAFLQTTKKYLVVAGKRGMSKELKATLQRLDVETGGKFKMPGAHLGELEIGQFNGNYWFSRDYGEGAIYLTSLFYVIGACRHVDDKNRRFVRICAREGDGTWKTFDIDGADAANTGKLVAAFLVNGVATDGNEGATLLQRSVANSVGLPGPAVFHAPGWKMVGGKLVDGKMKGGKLHFLTPLNQVVPPCALIELAEASTLTCAATGGTAAASRAATHALYSEPGLDLQHLAMFAGLASALMDLTHQPGFSIELEGRSGYGKSSIQMISVANWSDPELGAGLFKSSKSTINGLEAICAAGTATISALDDMRHVLAEDVSDLVYSQEGGVAKSRMGKDLNLLKGQKWYGILLMSCERSMTTRMREAGLPIEAGTTARLLSLSVDDKLVPTEEQWVHVTAMNTNFGWRGREFIKAVVDQGLTADVVVERREEYVFQLTPDGTQPEKRAARMIAIMWVAADICQRAGMIPKTFDVEGLMRRIWAEALAGELSASDPPGRAAKALLGRLFALRGSRLIDLASNQFSTSETWGFYGLHCTVKEKVNPTDEEAVDVPVYVISSSKLVAMASEVSKKQLLKALRMQGALVPSKTKNENTWSGFHNLGKEEQYVVLRAEKIENNPEAAAKNGTSGIDVVELAKMAEAMPTIPPRAAAVRTHTIRRPPQTGATLPMRGRY